MLTIQETAGGFALLHQNKTLLTPRKNAFLLPARALAEALKQEWEAGGGKAPVSARPLTGIAATALDIIAPDAEPMVLGLLAYAETDTLCYRAENPDLYARQEREWNEVLAWATARYDVHFHVTQGLLPLEQPETTLMRLRAALEAMSAMEMAAVSVLTQCYSSLILALAVYHRRYDAYTAFVLSRMEEDYQAGLWGEDEEAKKRTTALRADALSAAQFLELLKPM
jgi:chaperone required for assembly of F1-ATPase